MLSSFCRPGASADSVCAVQALLRGTSHQLGLGFGHQQAKPREYGHLRPLPCAILAMHARGSVHAHRGGACRIRDACEAGQVCSCLLAGAHALRHAYAHVHAHTYTHASVHMCAHTHLLLCAHMYTHSQIGTHSCTHACMTLAIRAPSIMATAGRTMSIHRAH